MDDQSKTMHVHSTHGPLAPELRPRDPLAATVYWVNASSIDGFTLTGNASGGQNGGALNLAGSAARRCIVRDTAGLGVYSYSATLPSCTILGPDPGIQVEFFSTLLLHNTIESASFSPGALGTQADPCAGVLPAGTLGVGDLTGDQGL